MDKKWGIIALIFIIIIGIGIFEFNNTFNSNKLFLVGSTNFQLPEGYTVGNPNQFGAVNITNGEFSIFLIEYNDTNVTKHINEYQKFIKSQNQTMGVLNLTVDGNLIYKAYNINNPNNVHYWFVKNKKTYEVYKWDENPKMEVIVTDLDKSLNNTN